MAEQTLQDGETRLVQGVLGSPAPFGAVTHHPGQRDCCPCLRGGLAQRRALGWQPGRWHVRSLRVGTLWPCVLQLTEGKRLPRW